jgi:hypothetical protein
MNKSKITLICLVLNSIVSLIPVSAMKDPYPICNSKSMKVYIDRDLKFDKHITAKSKLLGNAVYETILTEQSNISLDTKNYISVAPNSCEGAVYKSVCGF